MIRYKSGNLLESNAEALVNTVNTKGVMGKGIALQFKNRFPENFADYKREADKNTLKPGKMFVFENPGGSPRLIVNFPTKDHWKNDSQIEWIETGLQDLRRVIEERGIRSIALPALGCGHGGLDWDQIRPLIEKSLFPLSDVDIEVYDPSSSRIAETSMASASRAPSKGKKRRKRGEPAPGQQSMVGVLDPV